MRIKRKIISVFAALTVIAVSLSTHAFAYYIIQYQGINCGGVKDGYIVFQSWSGLSNETRWAIDYASRQWNTKTGNEVLYHSATQHDTNILSQADGRNLITKVALDPNKESGTLMLTSSYYYNTDPNRYHVESDIQINSLKKWYNNGSMNGYDIQNVMTHEFGHMLGLDEEPRYSAVTMYPYADYGETSKRTLEQDDLNGFHQIYG